LKTAQAIRAEPFTVSSGAQLSRRPFSGRTPAAAPRFITAAAQSFFLTACLAVTRLLELNPCIFWAGIAIGIHGPGGVYLFDGIADIRNCIFSGNMGNWSGAITALDMQTVFTNCTFTGNQGDYNATLSALAWLVSEPIAAGMIEINNCIFKDNTVLGRPEVIDGKAGVSKTIHTFR
jgi:hypothetical protein